MSDQGRAIIDAADAAMIRSQGMAFTLGYDLHILNQGQSETINVTYTGKFDTYYASALVRVDGPGGTEELSVISLYDGIIYWRKYGEDDWHQTYIEPSHYAVDFTSLFRVSADDGLHDDPREITKRTLTGEKMVDGVRTHTIEGEMQGLEIAGAKADLNVTYQVSVNDDLVYEVSAIGSLSIDPGTHLIGSPSVEEASITLKATLSNFGQDVEFQVPVLPGGRFGHDAILLHDGRVLVNGGWTGEPTGDFFPAFIDAVHILDPQTDLWLQEKRPPGLGYLGTAVMLKNGKVLIFHGGPWDPDPRMELLDATVMARALLPPPPSERAWADLVLLDDGNVMVTGNVDFTIHDDHHFEAENSRSVEIFDPGSGAWRDAASRASASPDDRFFKLHDGRVIVVRMHTAGGSQRSYRQMYDLPYRPETHIEIYSPESDSWLGIVRPVRDFLAQNAGVLHDGRLLVTGGLDSTPAAWTYDAVADSWTQVAAMPNLRVNASVVVLADGRVLVIGGEDPGRDDFSLFASSVIYDPVSDAWAPGPEMSESRSDHTATLMPDGTVLIIGGIGMGPDPGTVTVLDTFEVIAP